MNKKSPPSPDYYEHSAWQNNALVCGVDEVGRGCLAGPLIVVAAILPLNCPEHFKDSKKMTAKQRDAAFAWLNEHAIFTIARADHQRIATKNIYQATKAAMELSLMMLSSRHEKQWLHLSAILVDAMPITLPPLLQAPPIHSFIKGEESSRSIAAASIIAKVTRDRLMTRLSPLFPGYDFARNKAYASAHHAAALLQGPSSFIHRENFVKTLRTNLKERS